MPRSLRGRDGAAVVFLAALIVVAFADVFFQGSCFFVRDLTRYHFPMKSVLHRIVAQGALPLWNPYYSGGQPAIANPEYEFFYPGQWPIFLRDFYLGFRLHILLHFFIGAAGMYFLMRSLATRVAPALAASIAFILGGPFLSATNLLTTFLPLAWFPWTLLFVRAYVRERRRQDLAAAALCNAMIVLIFEPGCLLQIAAITAGFCLYEWRKGRPFVPTVLAAATPFVLAVLIAGVQVLPTLDFIRQTDRSRGIPYELATTWSMPPVRVGELLQPHLLGRNPFLSSDYWGAPLYGARGAPYFQSLYLGALMLVALIAGCALRNRRVVIGVSAAAAVLVVSFGDHTPLFRALRAAHIPLLLRFPERFAVSAAFLLLVAGGLAVDALLSDERWWRAARRLAIGAAALALLCVLFTETPVFVKWFAAMWGTPSSQAAATAFSRADWIAASLRFALLALLFIVARPRTRFASAALVAFTIIDLVPYVNEVAPRMPREYFSPPPAAAELKDASSQSRLFFLPESNQGPLMRRYLTDKLASYWVFRNGIFPRLPAAMGLPTVFERDIDRTNLKYSADLANAFRKNEPQNPAAFDPYAAIANVEWIALLRPPQTVETPAAVRPVTFVRLRPSPRYYFADETVRVQSLEEFTAELTSGRHRRQAAYLFSDGAMTGSGRVTKSVEAPNEIRLDVDAQTCALLVASVTRDPHWHATIDGAPAAIQPVNVAFQAIQVPPGRHHVELRYRNELVVAGGIVTAIGLLFTAFLLLRHPPVDVRLQHVERHRAGAEDGVVEGADVEAGAERLLGATA